MKQKRGNMNESFVKTNNDQLGENASEEFKSEEYSNSTKGKKIKLNN